MSSQSRAKKFLQVPICVCLCVGAISIAAAGSASADDAAYEKLFEDGHIILDARARIEIVDDLDFGREIVAKGSTVRLRLGYETGEYRNFKALVEGEFVQQFGFGTFNDTVNGKTQYPVIVDPNIQQLNRAQLTYTGLPDTIIIAGRQRIIIDNARFVGNVGFRQNEQTFDALRFINTSFADTTLSYTFIGGVNRIFGGNNPVGRLTGETHLFHAAYTGLPIGTVTGYVYLVDLEQAPRLSSKTYGVRVIGIRHPTERIQINYGFEFATQRDYAGNPSNFDLGYIMGEVGAKYEGEREAISLTAKIEWLDGDGDTGSMGGFSTPLATLHAFQGFADRFVVTPADGVKDTQVSVAYDMKALDFVKNLRLAVWFHKYSQVVDSGSYGREVDLAMIVSLTDRLTFTAKYADFNSQDFGVTADVEKIWITLGFRY